MQYTVEYNDGSQMGCKPVIVEGPEKDSWNAFCEGLLPRAVALAIEHNPDAWIGVTEVVEELVGFLQKLGYRVVTLNTFCLDGPIIYRKDMTLPSVNQILPSFLNDLIEHNEYIRRTDLQTREKDRE